MNIVWLRKDLRLTDNLLFAMASKRGETLPLFIIEPSVWGTGPLSSRHFSFLIESLDDLSLKLEEIGGHLYVAIGEAEEVFQLLLDAYGSYTVWLYNDSKLKHLFEWFKDKQIDIKIPISLPGELYKATSKKRWISIIGTLNEHAPPEKLYSPQEIPDWLLESTARFRSYPIKGEPLRFGQSGGETNAFETLNSFIDERVRKYSEGISNPLKASLYSSGLSAYLSWGNVSLKTVVLRTLEALPAASESEVKEYQFFLDKLYKRFLLVEKETSVTLYEDPLLKERRKLDQATLNKVFDGKAGIPIIDASMLCLMKSGWLPEGLRRLLVSFLCNTLLLEPQLVKEKLAGLMLDYEPAMYDILFQDCLALPGKVKAKILDPVREGKKIDQEGQFIARYVPQLGNLPTRYMHEPWKYPGFYTIGYHVPIIDCIKASRKNKSIIFEIEKAAGMVKPDKMANDSEQLTLDI
ncbi:FAD-binding domain-containing protein [Bacillus sp. EB01]|uniref:FAD-binding domain-containing protein n=1 Tax=Bacillus sp. EB01 TaxID=1347086 RepID=UPI0005C5B06B|nr:FAD-binding domain-containing protein [Bacillus sp. EB01]